MIEMKDSGVEWIGEIPNAWNIVPNKRIMKKKKDICEVYDGESILSLTMNGVIARDLENPSGKMPLTFDGYQKVKKGNLLMCLFDIDVTPRCIGIINDNGLTSPAYSQFELESNALNRYYYYYYLYLDFTKELLHVSKNLRHSLTESQLGELYVPLPAMDMQHRIADYLDSKCSKIDAIIEREQAVIEKLKEYKLSVITEAVTKGLNSDAEMKDSGIEWIGEIPKSWNVTKIKYVSNFNPPKKSKFSSYDEVGYVPMECLKNGYMQPRVIECNKISSGLTYFETGDIIMAKVTPCFENGNIAIAQNLKNNCAFGSSELFVFRSEYVEKNFLFYFLQNQIFKAMCISTMTGTGGLKRVSFDFIKNSKFALPEQVEQKEIADYLDQKCTQIEKTINKKQSVINKLTEYKKSLIYEVVTGKKEV